MCTAILGLATCGLEVRGEWMCVPGTNTRKNNNEKLSLSLHYAKNLFFPIFYYSYGVVPQKS